MLFLKIESIDLANLYLKPYVPPEHYEDVCVYVKQSFIIYRIKESM